MNGQGGNGCPGPTRGNYSKAGRGITLTPQFTNLQIEYVCHTVRPTIIYCRYCGSYLEKSCTDVIVSDIKNSDIEECTTVIHYNIMYINLTSTETRHRASTCMYLLTFRVCVTTPPQYGQNRTVHAAGASILSPVRGVFAACMRSTYGLPDGLPLGSATHFHSDDIAMQPVHRLQMRPTVHN